MPTLTFPILQCSGWKRFLCRNDLKWPSSVSVCFGWHGWRWQREIIFLDQYGTMKIARNFSNPSSINMLTNTRWSLTDNWKLQFLDQAYPSTDIRVQMTYEHNGNVFKSGVGVATKQDGKIEININGYGGNPAVTINYLSVSNGAMKGNYKDIQYSNSRSFPMNAQMDWYWRLVWPCLRTPLINTLVCYRCGWERSESDYYVEQKAEPHRQGFAF